MRIDINKFNAQAVRWSLFLLPLLFVFPLDARVVPYLILLLVSIYLLSTQGSVRRAYREFGSVAMAFGLYLPYSLVDVYLHDGSIGTADNGAHFLFFLLVASCFQYRNARRTFWWGLSAAAFAAGTLALYQHFILNLPHPYGSDDLGFSGAIKFGMITATFTLLALVAAIDNQLPLPHRVGHGVAVLVGVAGCIVIARRGPLLTLVLITSLIVIMRLLYYGKRRLAVLGIVAGFTALVVILNSQLQHRLSETLTEISSIHAGDLNTSIGIRILLWKTSIAMFIENPLIGVGMNQFDDHLQKMIATGVLPEFLGSFYHSHNEYLEALATGGIIGFAYFLWLIGAPIAYFSKHLAHRRGKPLANPAALGGLVSVLSFAFYSVTDNIFDRQVTTSLFAFLILGFAFITACTAQEQSHA